MIKTLIRNGLLVLGLCLSLSAFGLSLGEAKSQGLVGEQADGMLGIVMQPTAELTALVQDINGKRRAVYRDIAQRNGTDIQTVQQLAGEKAINKTPSGQYVKPAGYWQQVR